MIVTRKKNDLHMQVKG